MYSDKKKNPWIWAVPLVLVAVLIAVLCIVWIPGREERQMEGAQAIRDLIERTARQCYAVEGVYPPNLAYMEDHYGIAVNQTDYYVTYEAFASNVPPAVVVTPYGYTGAAEGLE